jgi:hypothetical protein
MRARNIWTPKWFIGHYTKFEPLMTKERSERKEMATDAYAFFDWLAKEKCPKVKDRYPEKSLL